MNVWHRARTGIPARVFWAYLAVALVIAMVSPGMAVFADEATPEQPGVNEPAVEPSLAEPVVEPVVEEPVVEEPVVEEPVVEEPVVAEPVVGEPAAATPETAPVKQPLIAKAVSEPEQTPRTGVPDPGWYRIDSPVTSGTYLLGSAWVTITVHLSEGEPYTFDFVSDTPVLGVKVKGGTEHIDPNAYWYPAPGVYSDDGLHAPFNTGSGKWYGISHIDFTFGELPEYVGKIKVYKYNDNDPTNAAYDDEPMLKGWTFILKDAAGAEVARGTTGDDGTYTFRNLPLGTYTVEEVLRSGWTNTTGLIKTVVLAAPTTAASKSADCDEPEPIVVRAEVWFGNVRTPVYDGKIIVHKYNDNDPTNGAFDDEPMLGGWEFILYSDQHVELARGTTGPDGTYTFPNLPLGTYYVEEVLTPGWINTTGLSQMVVLAAPTTATSKSADCDEPEPIEVVGDAWFGNVHESYEGKIIVHKYNDNDPTNGAFDDEEMLEGWEFILKDAQGVELARGTTGPDGTLTFTGLELGTYYVQEVLRPGWINTTGLSQMVVLAAPVYTGKYADIAVGPRPVEVTGDAWFGNVHESYIGKIIVHKFHDNDPTNGEYDDEEMLEGWEFILKDAAGSQIASGTTGPDGTLEFTGLALGTYTVEEVLRDGWDNTTPLAQTVVLSPPVYLISGERVFEVPAPVEIVGHAWFGNIREVYEKSFELTYAHKPEGLDSFKVTFWLNDVFTELPLVLDEGVFKASVQVEYPFEIADVTWWAHGPDGWIWLGSVYGTEVLEGDLTNYFHYDPSLSGYKYADLDGDGSWGEEPAIPGWTIYLYRLPDPQRFTDAVTPPLGAVLVAQTVTDENGYYEFTGMLPGLYYIVEEERPGWTPTEWPEDQPIMIENETHVSDLNFGNMPPAEKTFELTFIDAPEGLEYLVRYWIEGEAGPHEIELVGDNPFSGSVEVTVGTTLTSIEWIAIRDEEEFVLGTTGPETIDEDLLNEFEYRSHIGGYKFDDEDGEGDWDEGEPPIEGWKITLYREVSSPPPVVDVGASAIALIPMAETFTDGEGYYEFNGLLPGTYLVQEEDREGWDMTLSPDGTFVVENGTDRDDLIFGNSQFLTFEELDLAITKVADVEWADPGDVITYTLTYWNNDETPATNFTIVDDYDERYLTVVDSAGGVVSGGKIAWSLPGPLTKADGPKTITYTMRVITDMPDGTTNLDNTVEIKHPKDRDPRNNKDDERVRVKVGDEPFLPFTGSEYLLLLAAAVIAGAAGVTLRVRSARAA